MKKPVRQVRYEVSMVPHWTCRLALPLVFLIGLTGCPEGEPFEGCSPPIQREAGPANPGIVRVGEPSRVFALPLIFQACSNTSGLPSSATAEITGPGGEALEAQVQLGTPTSSTAIQFTPAQPGPHHILLEFVPRGGIHQIDVHAALDRSAETSSQLISRSCDSLERTLQGAWVCNSTVLRGTESLGSFPNARLAVAGDVIWVVDGSTVSRYVDTGTALMLTGTASRPSGGTEFLLASPDELVALLSTSLMLYTFQGGVVTAGAATSWTRPALPTMPESPYGVLLREGSQLAIATRASSASSALVQVCPYQLLSGRFERTTGACQQFPGEIIGFEPGVLWTRDAPTITLSLPVPARIHRQVWAGGQVTEQGSLSLGFQVVFISAHPRTRPAAVPLVRNAPPSSNFPSIPTSEIPAVTSMARWSPQRKALVLEHLDEAMTGGSASPTLYWGPASPSASQPTKVFLRPPTL